MKLSRFLLLLIISLIPCSLFSNTLYFPQVAFGGGYTTTFVVMNTGTTNVSSRINFYAQDGALTSFQSINVPVGGSTRYTLPDTGPLTAVWGELAAGTATVQGVATFDLRATNGTLITTAGVLGLEAGNSFLLPVDVTPTASTGVAIANINAGSSVNVTLRLLGENGSQAATATDVRLNPLRSRSQIADFVTSMFPQLTGTTFKGTLVIEAAAGAPTKSLVATALTVKEGLLSALPVIPVTVSTTPPPSSVPVAPSNLLATVASASQINLSWSDNSNNETGFRIEMKLGADGTYREIGTVGANGDAQITGLSALTTYYFRVRAYNGGGNSGYSNEANATTSAPPTATAMVYFVAGFSGASSVTFQGETWITGAEHTFTLSSGNVRNDRHSGSKRNRFYCLRERGRTLGHGRGGARVAPER